MTYYYAAPCVFLSGINACEQDPEPGPCEAYIPSFFYNATSQRCERFVYGGCQGNRNRFSSATDCQRACGEYYLCCKILQTFTDLLVA